MIKSNIDAMTNIQRIILFSSFFTATISTVLQAQVKWVNVDSNYAPLPPDFHVFKSIDSLDGKPFIAYYAVADIKKKALQFSTDTTYKRRLTPSGFFQKNASPLLVVNTTFFSFETNQNLNVVIQNGKLVSYNIHSLPGRGKDTFTYRHPFNGALGITKKRTADVAWIYSDSSHKKAYASQTAIEFSKDSTSKKPFKEFINVHSMNNNAIAPSFRKWKMQTAVGGGPVLVQDSQMKITNDEELKFAGKAIEDMHPRTLIGYTTDQRLIIMVIEGRNAGVADGATLTQCARLMIGVGSVEALNLDGGGSSCLLINGKETIRPSDKGLQRAVPAVLIITSKLY